METPGTNATEPQAVTAPTDESTTPQPAAAQDPQLGRAFALLARREKEIKAREAALKAKEPVVSTYEQRQQLKKDNLLKFLEEEGLSFEDITKAQLATLKPEGDKKLESVEARLQKLVEEREREKQEREERDVEDQLARIETAKDFYKQEAKEFITAHADDYELIIASDALDDVFSVVEEFFAETLNDPERYPNGPILLDPKVAADHVEKLLLEQYEPLTRTKKLASRTSSGTTDAFKVRSDERVTSRPSPTINNSMVLSDARSEPTSEEERIKRAAAKLRYVDKAS